jgi:hypothetical protein
MHDSVNDNLTLDFIEADPKPRRHDAFAMFSEQLALPFSLVKR